MVTRDVEIPGGRIIFPPKVLFTRDADAWDVKLMIRCAVKGTNLADRGRLDGRGVTDPVQRVQGYGGSGKRGDGNESIQGCNNYAGPDSGGEMLQGWKRGARSMGLGRLGSTTQGYRQASNKRIKITTRTRSSRLVNRARGFFACVVTNGRRLT